MGCEICGDPLDHPDRGSMKDDIEYTVKHLKEAHPKEYGDGPERWPDGEVILTFAEPTPEDVQRWK